MKPAPKGKLDDGASLKNSETSENGPEGVLQSWHSVDWAKAEGNVRRLRQRIFKAAQQGNLKQVHNLQKLMLRSYSSTLVSVKRVSQLSAGRKTAGIDGVRSLTPQQRYGLATEIHAEARLSKAVPVKRVYIPKSNGKQRPLGIPVIRDRVLQARVKNALEPEWESKFEARNYGFRPGRGCHDALEAIFNAGSSRGKRVWVLDADLAGAFDRIDHHHLMQSIGSFPAREAVRGWLKAGVMESGRFTPTEEGAPQGGVISPLLLNIALHGMEKAVGCRYRKKGAGREMSAVPGTPILIRYADDFVVFCYTKEEAESVQERLGEWLAPRGLSFNAEKTKTVHLDQGFDFLGFNVRRYGGQLLTKPSRAATKRIKERLRDEVKHLRGANAEALIAKLTPIIRGWATYYRVAVSSKVFSALDTYVWRLTYKWGRYTHPTKSKTWVVDRYFGRFNPARNDRWVFGAQQGAYYLRKFAWSKIVRHDMVKGLASPDDPSLTQYWDKRRRKAIPKAFDKKSLSLAYLQKGICPMCRQDLIAGAEYQPDNPREWIDWFAASRKMVHKHHLVYRSLGGSDERSNLRLVHSDCHRQHHANDQRVGGRIVAARPLRSA
ncbi:group II intron reverse transcriptase/maturase [Streptomyces sp. NBC_00654]|uniref:group II intron reverse transcriptase/maturase n=1 Tax=Streptomyces sp. NBC_00654 TaxID=2975799 RepID=UPI00225B0B06|nr:group II intron reverse transcriptase/maturase [Streptomyces sp. NBC_00654]MCX4971220.1 group II intron reverse transcriptase/maturase [Streptomyces sp. NBC_00654]